MKMAFTANEQKCSNASCVWITKLLKVIRDSSAAMCCAIERDTFSPAYYCFIFYHLSFGKQVKHSQLC